MSKWFFDKWGYLHARWVYALLVIAFLLFLWGINGLMGYECSETAELYQLEHRYRWSTGCNVLIDGEYWSIDNVRVVIDQ